jgi:hypothetical protein
VIEIDESISRPDLLPQGLAGHDTACVIQQRVENLKGLLRKAERVPFLRSSPAARSLRRRQSAQVWLRSSMVAVAWLKCPLVYTAAESDRRRMLDNRDRAGRGYNIGPPTVAWPVDSTSLRRSFGPEPEPSMNRDLRTVFRCRATRHFLVTRFVYRQRFRKYYDSGSAFRSSRASGGGHFYPVAPGIFCAVESLVGGADDRVGIAGGRTGIGYPDANGYVELLNRRISC